MQVSIVVAYYYVSSEKVISTYYAYSILHEILQSVISFDMVRITRNNIVEASVTDLFNKKSETRVERYYKGKIYNAE